MSPGTAAAAGATTQSTLQELQTLPEAGWHWILLASVASVMHGGAPEADLRRIRDCSFVHHGTFHRFCLSLRLLRRPGQSIPLK